MLSVVEMNREKLTAQGGWKKDFSNPISNLQDIFPYTSEDVKVNEVSIIYLII